MTKKDYALLKKAAKALKRVNHEYFMIKNKRFNFIGCSSKCTMQHLIDEFDIFVNFYLEKPE